jgi:hypothetical protein
MLGAIRHLKNALVPRGRRQYKIPLGLLRGLNLHLDLASQFLVYLGLWETETYHFLRQAGRDCSCLIDVGSGKGELVVWYLALDPARRAFAIEPQASENAFLRANLVINAGIADRVEVIESFSGWREDTSIVRIDDLALPPSGRILIKVDVDGGELDVLKGATKTLQNRACTILVETHSKDLEQSCCALLQSENYTVRIIKNAWWRLFIPENRTIEHNRWLWAERADGLRPR